MKIQEHQQTLNEQAYPSGYGYMYPQNSQIRSCVVFDGGNRFIKWIDPSNQVRIIPSCIKEVSEYQWKRLRPDPETVFLEIDKKRYIVGKLAQNLGGEPTFQKDKCELAEILALVAIEPNPGSSNVHISKFAIALPNSLNDDDVAAVKRLENYPLTKEFKRNGQHICYTIAN
ncbi:MAG TPA: StbA family protein, partial [Coleofasciculaceae cyanobacterium]